jgi:hypothetical protein
MNQRRKIQRNLSEKYIDFFMIYMQLGFLNLSQFVKDKKMKMQKCKNFFDNKNRDKLLVSKLESLNILE